MLDCTYFSLVGIITFAFQNNTVKVADRLIQYISAKYVRRIFYYYSSRITKQTDSWIYYYKTVSIPNNNDVMLISIMKLNMYCEK